MSRRRREADEPNDLLLLTDERMEQLSLDVQINIFNLKETRLLDMSGLLVKKVMTGSCKTLWINVVFNVLYE